MPVNPYVDAGLAAFNTGVNYFTGAPAAKANKEYLRRQAQMIQRQAQTYAQVEPTYLQAVQGLAQRAGIGGYGGQGAGLGGAYGTAEDRLAMQAAEEQNRRQQMASQNRLQATLAQRGIATGSQAAALAQNARQYQGQLNNFNRDLAIRAGQEQSNRYQQLLAALNPGLGMGAQATAGYSNLANNYGQQAANAYGNIQNALAQYAYGRQLAPQAPPDPYAEMRSYGFSPDYDTTTQGYINSVPSYELTGTLTPEQRRALLINAGY